MTKKGKSSAGSAGVVKSKDLPAGKPKVSRRLIIVAAVVILLVALAASWYLWMRPEKNTETPSKESKRTSLEGTVNKRYALNDYEGAVKAAEAQKGTDPESQLILASAYTNNKQYDKAFAIYDQLIKDNKLSGGDAMTAGETAAYVGNKEKAISYYETAQTLLKGDTSAFAKRDRKSVERHLQELQQ